MPHLEVTIAGTPVSPQGKNKTNLNAWVAKIKAEVAKVWTGPPLTGHLKFTVYNVHAGDKPALDDDNMVKPIRDALNKIVYLDDGQIRNSETKHICIDNPQIIRGASLVLLTAFSNGAEFVYIRVDDAPAIHKLPS